MLIGYFTVALPLLVIGLLFGCTESLSELILVVDTDLEVPEELSRITLDITEGGETQVRGFLLDKVCWHHLTPEIFRIPLWGLL